MLEEKLKEISNTGVTPLDLLPQSDLREKFVELVLKGVPSNIYSSAKVCLEELRSLLLNTPVDDAKVVVFGGGTGLSNIIGGDSRQPSWGKSPFGGLKEIFHKTRSVICVTDDGGSTGELLKDLDLIAIGDIRHVMLSSIQLSKLQKKYNLDRDEAGKVAVGLAHIFNWRFTGPLTISHPEWPEIVERVDGLPHALASYLNRLFDDLFAEQCFNNVRKRSHCFGNLLVAAAIYRERKHCKRKEIRNNYTTDMHSAIRVGLNSLGEAIGAGLFAVMPCTSTPAQLRIRYTNGVEITGEHKLSTIKRGVPVDTIDVDYCDRPRSYDEVMDYIGQADLIVLAPGSLYSSIIPVFKVPGFAEAVRRNKKALKILVSNLWVQAGETDLSIEDPDRKFQVSDMIKAYETNIPGGTEGLFQEILCVSLKDIPASILQSYAVEGKIPIYLDKDKLAEYGLTPVECDIYSRRAINERGVIQHDPDNLALAIKGLFNGRACYLKEKASENFKVQPEVIPKKAEILNFRKFERPFNKYSRIKEKIETLEVKYIGLENCDNSVSLKQDITDILWDHPIIPFKHLTYCKDVHCIAPALWGRDQKWDNVFSYFDPNDYCIKIRADQVGVRANLEIAIMIAIGESLLGDYAAEKSIKAVLSENVELGSVYHLHLRPEQERNCFLTHSELTIFLNLARMCKAESEYHYTRLVNRGEGFTPPGLLMGLMYAWYVDNRLATHIEYKMSVLKINRTDLIPEQLRMAQKRRNMIDFFREVIFKGD